MKHSKNRLMALSDGIFAFASTLMVIDIGTSINLNEIDTQLPLFISFGVAFFVMIILWKVHYNFFQRTTYIDNWIITFNTVLLFTILFYLFPLKSLVNSSINKISVTPENLAYLFILYGIGFVLIFTMVVLLYWRAYKKDCKAMNPLQLKFYAIHFSIFIIAGLISILLAVFKIGLVYGVPGFAYAILGPLCYINGVRFRKISSENGLHGKPNS